MSASIWSQCLLTTPLKSTLKYRPWGFSEFNAFYCTAGGRDYTRHMLQCTVQQQSHSAPAEKDFPFPPVYKKQEGERHSSIQIEETTTRCFTLFNHSTRSMSGKWTWNKEKTANFHQTLFALLSICTIISLGINQVLSLHHCLSKCVHVKCDRENLALFALQLALNSSYSWRWLDSNQFLSTNKVSNLIISSSHHRGRLKGSYSNF